MTVREAGKLGGLARKAELGEEGYRDLGRKGGQTTKDRHGADFYSRIGKMGGDTLSRQRGPQFFSEIGKKGGDRVRELIAKGQAMDEDAAQESHVAPVAPAASVARVTSLDAPPASPAVARTRYQLWECDSQTGRPLRPVLSPVTRGEAEHRLKAYQETYTQRRFAIKPAD